jgi:hypothetical protein
VWLEIDGLVVEEFELSLWLAAGRDSWHDIVGDDVAVHDDLLSATLLG